MIVKIEFEVKIPPEAGPVTHQQIEEWARFNLYELAMQNVNPLSNFDMEAVSNTVRVR